MTYPDYEYKRYIGEDSDPPEEDSDDPEEQEADLESLPGGSWSLENSSPKLNLPHNWKDHVRHNLLVLKAACDFLGLEGDVTLAAPDTPTGQDGDRRVIHTSELEVLAQQDPENLKRYEIEVWGLHVAGEPERNVGNPFATARIDINHGRIKGKPGNGQSDEANCKLLKDHADMLTEMGMYPFVSTALYEVADSILVAIPVREPFDPDGDTEAGDAMWQLTSIGPEQKFENGEWIGEDSYYHGEVNVWYYPLCATIFPLDKTPREIVENALEPAELICLANDWTKSGRNHQVFRNMGAQLRRADRDKRTEYLVRGLVPFGIVTLLAGEREIGKSTLAHELAIAAATPAAANGEPKKWLGCEVTTSRPEGVAALISGEDPWPVLNERNKLLDPQTKAANLYIREGNLRNLDDILGDLSGVPELRLVVLDPARAFADGSEDQSERASAFFDKLIALARKKDCAVVVVHHLGKNARPKSLDDVEQKIRGSGVYVDRPRVVLGMYRSGRDKAKRITRIGIAKWNLLDKDKAYEGARPFAQDEVALRHLPADEVALEGAHRTPSGHSGPDADGEAVTAIEGLDVSILNAIDRLNGAGHDITRTGPKSLHSKRQLIPGLADIKRREIESAVDRLIAEGAIHVQDGGLQAVRS